MAPRDSEVDGMTSAMPGEDAAQFFSLQRGGSGCAEGESVRYVPSESAYDRRMVTADED